MTAAPQTPQIDEGWDPMDHPTMRKRIEDGAIEEFTRMFPQEYGSVRLEAENIHLGGKPTFTNAEQKKALMENRTLVRPLKADLSLYDRESGELLEHRPKITLMRVPFYTDRGTFIHNGNDYTGSSMSRMMPGMYARRQENGALEMQGNVRSGTGRVFRIGMDQETGQFRFKIAGSNLHLYSMLKDLGVSDQELDEAWGPEVAEMNRRKYDGRTLGKAYAKLVPRYLQDERSPTPLKQQAIIDALKKAQVSKEVIDRTLAAYWKPRNPEKMAKSEFNKLLLSLLPQEKSAITAVPAFDVRSQMGDVDDEGDEYRSVDVDGLLAATRKLLAINRGQDVTDQRNAPAFAKLYPMDKLMRERIRLDDGKIRRNLMRMVASRRNLSPLAHRAFDPYYIDVITKSPLTTPLEETNPLQLIGQHRRVTVMGPGGIGSSDAITPSMQCHSADTEVFTKNGWKFWPHITSEDLLACRVKGRLEFHLPEALHADFYEGPMYGVVTKGINFLVTPNHRFFSASGSRTPESSWKWETAEEQWGKQRCHATNSAPYVGNCDEDTFTLEEATSLPGGRSTKDAGNIDMGDWCEFLGWYMAEGSRFHDGKGNNYLITISQCPQVNPNKWKKIQALLARLPFSFCCSDTSKNFRAYSKQLFTYLDQFGYCQDKFLPDFLFEVKPEYRRRFLDAFLAGDGWIQQSGSGVYSTSSENLADDLEKLLIGLGSPVTRGTPWRAKRRDGTPSSWIHRVNELTNTIATTKPNQQRLIEYKGTVYCATVPGGLLLTRRGSVCKPIWTGNSIYASEFGFYSPLEGPESERSGVDVRMAWNTRIGKDGRIRQEFLNRKTGQLERVSPQDLYGKFLKLPD